MIAALMPARRPLLVEHGAADLRPGELDRIHLGVINKYLAEGGASETHALEACLG